MPRTLAWCPSSSASSAAAATSSSSRLANGNRSSACAGWSTTRGRVKRCRSAKAPSCLRIRIRARLHRYRRPPATAPTQRGNHLGEDEPENPKNAEQAGNLEHGQRIGMPAVNRRDRSGDDQHTYAEPEKSCCEGNDATREKARP